MGTAPFAVPEDYKFRAGIGQHCGGDIASVRAFCSGMAILGAHADNLGRKGLVLVAAEHDHGHPGADLDEPLDGLAALGVGKVQVDEHDVAAHLGEAVERVRETTFVANVEDRVAAIPRQRDLHESRVGLRGR